MSLFGPGTTKGAAVSLPQGSTAVALTWPAADWTNGSYVFDFLIDYSPDSGVTWASDASIQAPAFGWVFPCGGLGMQGGPAVDRHGHAITTHFVLQDLAMPDPVNGGWMAPTIPATAMVRELILGVGPTAFSTVFTFTFPASAALAAQAVA